MNLHASERTALLNDGIRYHQSKKWNLRKFQYCLYVIFTFLLIATLVVFVSVTSNDTATFEVSENRTAAVNEDLPIFFFTWPVQDKNMSETITTHDDLWQESAVAGEMALQNQDILEESVPHLSMDSPSYKHQTVFLSSEKSRRYSRIGLAKDYATKYFYSKANITNSTMVCRNERENWLTYINFRSRTSGCRHDSTFRSYNGSCNNLLHPNEFGVAFQKFRRAFPPDYADGINVPRKSITGGDLPSSRTVSFTVHRSSYKNDFRFTVMLAVWGQFIDHDVTATALTRGPNGTSIACCVSNPHPECFPVAIDWSDPYYARYNVTCMEFVRSAPAPSRCLGPREQMTQTSAFLDGSVIYGADEATSNRLRTFNRGLLKMLVTKDNRTLLPVSDDLDDGCNRREEILKGRYCFMTGDSRANENLFLTTMHLIWARHHNVIAKVLGKVNPKWDDERIFEETRKIVGAQIQHITYKEFLPIVLGDTLMKKSKLSLKKKGYFTGYNNSVDPSIANSFATATFRFGHSLMPTSVKIPADNYSHLESVKLHQILFDPFRLYDPGYLNRNIRGAVVTPIQANGPYFSSELKEHLFEDRQHMKKNICGLDLVSLNIQRGRDHGLPGYTKWRQHCGLKQVKSFGDLRKVVRKDSFNAIKRIYRNVNDVDLYTGALSEHQLPGSVLGPTFTCLLVDQFARLKVGDRFWYENPPPQGFTENQLKEIRKTTLAKILCSNSDQPISIPIDVMRSSNESNRYVPCSKIQRPQLKHWKANS